MFDLMVEGWISPIRTSFGIHFFTFFTEIARGLPVAVMLVTVAALFWGHGLRRQAKVLILAALGSELASFSLKILFARARPEYALVDEATFAFPSGHAVIAFSFFALTFFLLAREVSSKLLANLFRASGVLLASLIALSRLYLGVHYATDVLAGAALGIFACIIALRALDKKQKFS